MKVYNTAVRIISHKLGQLPDRKDIDLMNVKPFYCSKNWVYKNLYIATPSLRGFCFLLILDLLDFHVVVVVGPDKDFIYPVQDTVPL